MSPYSANTNQVAWALRSGKLVRITVDHIECGHLMDARVADSVRDAIAAAREAGLYVSIVTAWRTHGQNSDGRRIELYCGDDKTSDYEQFLAIAQAHGFSQIDKAKPGLFMVADCDVTPVDK